MNKIWVLKDDNSNRALIRGEGEKWPDDIDGEPSKKWKPYVAEEFSKMITIIYQVRNKVFGVLFGNKEDAEKYMRANATPANGLEITELQVFGNIGSPDNQGTSK